ncbi:MAG: tmk [Parcubacteria group bacterium]|nr:tmk [Parcubacteria group bacterium]
MEKGLFIVLDGNDGSGKATQTQRLAQYLGGKGIPYTKVDFPAYEQNFFGALVGECLAGQHGDFLHMDPKVASTLYALDRLESAPRVRAALAEGKVVIADRYASSNQIHQGGKIEDLPARTEFLKWLDTMEFEILGIPRPDAIIYLRVPVERSLALLSEKRAAKNVHVGEGKDMVEEDRQYLERSHETANWLSSNESNWHVIMCEKDGAMRAIDDISAEIISHVETLR